MASREATEPRRRSTWARGAVAIVLLCGSLAAGHAAWAAFTGTATPTHSVATGTVNLSLPAAGTDNRLTVNIGPPTGLYPGSLHYRRFSLTNSGSLTLKTVTATASVAAPLGTNGNLKWKIERCTVGAPTAWAESGTTPNFTYLCTGNTDTFGAFENMGTAQVLTTVAPLAPAAVNYYLLTITLDAGAAADTMSASAGITFTFDATQRDAASK